MMSNLFTHSEGGFTLVELIIGMAIGAMLIGAAGAALVIGLRTTEEAGHQVSEAAWAQIVGGWFLSDVHSVEQIGVEPTCDLSTPDEIIGTFSWISDPNFVPPLERHVVWWIAEDDVLMRTECSNDLMPVRWVVLAEETEDASITCTATRCTVTWTAMETETADRSDADRTYSMTVVRRS